MFRASNTSVQIVKIWITEIKHSKWATREVSYCISGEKPSPFNPYQKLNNYQTLEAIYMLNWKINSACKLQLSCCDRGMNDHADSAKKK